MDYRIIGARITDSLQREHMTLKDLSRKIGVTEATVSRWCTGDRIPTAKGIIDIANVFNVSADYLLGLKDSEER